MSPPPTRPLAYLVHALTVDAEPFLSCDECFDRICAYVERVTEDPQYVDGAMQEHLRTCGVCADEADVLVELLEADVGRECGSPPGSHV